MDSKIQKVGDETHEEFRVSMSKKRMPKKKDMTDPRRITCEDFQRPKDFSEILRPFQLFDMNKILKLWLFKHKTNICSSDYLEIQSSLFYLNTD